MDKFPIDVKRGSKLYHFDVVDYVHHEGERCKFELFQAGQLVAALDPDPHEHLHICKNPGQVDETVLHLVIEKLESMPGTL